MSPNYFDATNTAAREFNQYAAGFADDGWVTDGDGLRPVINWISYYEI